MEGIPWVDFTGPRQGWAWGVPAEGGSGRASRAQSEPAGANSVWQGSLPRGAGGSPLPGGTRSRFRVERDGTGALGPPRPGSSPGGWPRGRGARGGAGRGASKQSTRGTPLPPSPQGREDCMRGERTTGCRPRAESACAAPGPAWAAARGRRGAHQAAAAPSSPRAAPAGRP